MTSRQVLCLRPQDDFARVDALPPGSLAVTYRKPDDGDVPQRMKSADALVMPAVGPKLPAEWFEGTTLQLVQVTGAGLDRLDLAALARARIPLANVPGGSNSAVAEYAVTAASLLLRRFAWADAEVKRGNYAAFRARMLADNLRGLDGAMAGIVGLGVIGLAVAQAFHKAGCRLCYHDPASANAAAARALDAESLLLEDLLVRSDVVTVHVPLVPGTRGLIGVGELARMQPGAVLVQGSRGGIVDEAALAAALNSGHIGGAAVDVYSTEPPGSDNPLLALRHEAAQRVLFTPHVAGVTRQSSAFLFRSSWANVERVLVRGEPPLNRVG